ncbi:MAG: zinc-dependent metalloprotease [Nocardioidaceae bacterium]
MTTMIDWDLAVSTGSALAGPGPAITPDQADAVVGELRAGAERSSPLVRDFTGMSVTAADDLSAAAPVLVVDRLGWIQANADAFASVMSPLIEKLQAKRHRPDRPGSTGSSGNLGSTVTDAVGSKLTGLEVGGLLGFLSSKVLGQFDPFFPPTGRLLLVAPNIVHVERELDVDAADFRLWVCLHEETHRVQFTAVPWLRDHIHEQIGQLVGSVDLDPSRIAAVLGEGVRRIGEVVRGDSEVSIVELFSSPEQREVLDRLTGVMSLLEGHADVVMDGVGPEVIASVAAIRAKFDRRRKSGSGYLDRVLRRLLGLDAKMAQYRDGAAFVRAVVDRVGMDGFNAVWTDPQHLPSKQEVLAPDTWVRRVHG